MKKSLESPWGMEPQTFGFREGPRSDALPLSHRYSSVSEVYYEVHITHVLHTSRICNVDRVMFVNRNKRENRSAESEGLRFDSSWELGIFSSSHARDKTKNVFL